MADLLGGDTLTNSGYLVTQFTVDLTGEIVESGFDRQSVGSILISD